MLTVAISGSKAELHLLTLGEVSHVQRGRSHTRSEQHLNGCVESSDSSMTRSTTFGSLFIAENTSGQRARVKRALPSRFLVVSLPAIISIIIWVRTATSDSGSPSRSARKSRVITSSGGSASSLRVGNQGLDVTGELGVYCSNP